MHRRDFLAVGFLSLCGCVAGPRVVESGQPPLQELEPLYAATAGRDALSISVASNGCTGKADFTFYAERRGEALALAFARRRVDPCRSFAMGRTDLTFSWAELGVSPHAPVFLLNPVVAWTGPGS